MNLLKFTFLSSLAVCVSVSTFAQKKDDKKTEEVKPVAAAPALLQQNQPKLQKLVQNLTKK